MRLFAFLLSMNMNLKEIQHYYRLQRNRKRATYFHLILLGYRYPIHLRGIILMKLPVNFRGMQTHPQIIGKLQLSLWGGLALLM